MQEKPCICCLVCVCRGENAPKPPHRITATISGEKTLLPREAAIPFSRQPLDKTHSSLHSV